ncbi:hypothetical protein [Agreia pratensis]|uniref:DNA gyrase subunit B n=1 Tax=Agreia pratensis TaxID=150121 RepID=A0A1X7KUC7_9MICO|nr:hypothetical protein [Agreia pratensis]SMG45143.1 DNA gyrase subunit B [Agreia pratensis]
MTNSLRESWAATTHNWTHDVDFEHLRVARKLVGPVGCAQLMHMVLEVAAYADDEAYDQQRIGLVLIEVSDDQISVADDGRGTDTRRDAHGVAVRKPVMATQDIRFFARQDAPALPDGEPRRGMSAVAAACEQLVHENRRHDGAWSQTYERGVPTSALEDAGQQSETGTVVRLCRLDRQVVADVDLARLRSLLGAFRHIEVVVRSLRTTAQAQ